MITLRTCLLTSLIFASPYAYAEYYLVYPAANVIDCADCYARPTWKHHHSKHHHSTRPHVAHKKHHHHRSSYSITVYYPWRIVTPCYTCCATNTHYRDAIIDYNSMPVSHSRGRYIHDNPYDYYNPDMSTGDDDASVYPDMNINN